MTGSELVLKVATVSGERSDEYACVPGGSEHRTKAPGKECDKTQAEQYREILGIGSGISSNLACIKYKGTIVSFTDSHTSQTEGCTDSVLPFLALTQPLELMAASSDHAGECQKQFSVLLK
ncbi:hypothetical protein EYF80_022502 [Liparis tanakae]|uniref:Uncharacterized protein n=1 Tax=Liparis tanakae TaxID=230148 RepID=A0A4Z2HQF9_9TELE|nr:hypothetical protein EYF80_022502 [Liparis tanakae]